MLVVRLCGVVGVYIVLDRALECLRSSVVFLIESTTGKFRDGRVVLCACMLCVYRAWCVFA
jgi:hypothetical protein